MFVCYDTPRRAYTGAVEANRSANVAAQEEPLSRPLLSERLRAAPGVVTRADVRWLVGILVVALVLRVLWTSAVQPDPRDGRFDDSVWYYGTATHLAAGDGYVFPGDAFCQFGDGIGCDETPPTALWAPGYSIVLAAVFQLPGDDIAAARGLNIVAGLALVVLVYYLGRRLWSSRAGLIAAAIIAVFPSHVFFSSLVLAETLFTAMAVGLLCLALAWTMDETTTRPRLLILGIAAAALAMVRPEGIVFLGVIILTWIAVHRAPRRVAAYAGWLALGAAVVFVPWTVRNAVQVGWPTPGTTGMGQVLIQAHNPEAGGEPDIYIATRLYDDYDEIPWPEREVTINREATKESVSYALHNIPREFTLMPLRFAAFYRGDRGGVDWNQREDGRGRRQLSAGAANLWGAVADSYYYSVLAVAFFGLAFWIRKSRGVHWLLWGPIVIYSLMWWFLFVGESRYHFPLLPLFALIAAIGLAALSERWLPDNREEAS